MIKTHCLLFTFLILFSCVFSNVFGQSGSSDAITRLAGPLNDTIRQSNSPYIVTGDITVQPGKVVFIEPGTIIRFKNFTGLKVFGTLIARGTADKIISFTSENDVLDSQEKGIAPAPYDWDGITVSEDAIGTVFEDCHIKYSLFGIKSLLAYITIKDCYFVRNGRADVTIGGEKKTVTAGTPFSYISKNTQSLATQTIPQVLQKPEHKLKGFFTIASIGLLAGGAVYGVWNTMEMVEAQNTRESLTPGINDPKTQTDEEQNRKAYDEAILKEKQSRYKAAAGYGGALLGAITLTITLTRL